MLAAPEHYKGMVYVRLSALPLDQRNNFRHGQNREKIIKILKDNALMNDCVLYEDYVECVKTEAENSGQKLSVNSKEFAPVAVTK